MVALPSLWAGFFADDLLHVAVLEGTSAPATPWSLFTFASGDVNELKPFIERGPYPWWTYPELRLSFFRPLSTLLIHVDHALFGRWAPGYHLHSILWYALAVVAVSLLYRAVLPAAVAAVALLLFAVDGNHFVAAAWPANRNALAAFVPAMIAVWAYLRFREGAASSIYALVPLGILLSLFAGESALAVLAYLLAYELVGATGQLRYRLPNLIIPALCGIGFVVLYKVKRFGAWGSGVYIDPTQSPLDFLLAAPARFFALAGAGLVHAPADLWLLVMGARPAIVGAGVLSVGLAGWAAWSTWPSLPEPAQRTLRWLMLGSALSLIPVLATFPANRLLFVPSVGSCALFSVLLWHARGLAKTIGIGFVAIHVLVSVIAWPSSALLFRSVMQAGYAAVEASEIDPATAASQHLVVLNAPDPLIGLYHPIIGAMEKRPMPYAWQVMTMVPYDVRFTRTSPAEFQLQIVDGTMLTTIFEKIVRADSLPLQIGEPYRISSMTVRVLEMEGIGPTRISAVLDAPMEDPRWSFLEWRDGALRRFKVPAVGETVLLKHERGPMEL